MNHSTIRSDLGSTICIVGILYIQNNQFLQLINPAVQFILNGFNLCLNCLHFYIYFYFRFHHLSSVPLHLQINICTGDSRITILLQGSELRDTTQKQHIRQLYVRLWIQRLCFSSSQTQQLSEKRIMGLHSLFKKQYCFGTVGWAAGRASGL